jgi:hypothetical protein
LSDPVAFIDRHSFAFPPHYFPMTTRLQTANDDTLLWTVKLLEENVGVIESSPTALAEKATMTWWFHQSKKAIC